MTEGGAPALNDYTGNTTQASFGDNRYRGDVYSVTERTVLTGFESYLNFTGTRQLEFVVLEGPSDFGPFTVVRRQSRTQTGTGEGFYSSGPMSVLLEPGKYYAIAVGWTGGNITYFFESTPNPVPVSFGQEVYGFAHDTYPMGTTVGALGLLVGSIYQRLTTEDTWLLVNPSVGSVPPGDSVTVTVTADPTGLPTGTYAGQLEIATNDPNASTTVIPVTMNLTQTDNLVVKPDSAFTASGFQGGPFVPPCKTYTLRNVGGTALSWAATCGAPWISASPASGSIAVGDSALVDVCLTEVAGSLEPSSYESECTFTNVNVDSSQVRTVQLVVQECWDFDGDGWTSCAGDCDDDNPNVHPGALENCSNGIDDNCDDVIDNCPDTLFDDFVSLESCTYQILRGPSSIWNVRLDGGRLRISKPSGGPAPIHNGGIWPNLWLRGNFDVQVRYWFYSYAAHDQAQINLHNGSDRTFLFDVQRGVESTPIRATILYIHLPVGSAEGRQHQTPRVICESLGQGRKLPDGRSRLEERGRALCTRTVHANPVSFT